MLSQIRTTLDSGGRLLEDRGLRRGRRGSIASGGGAADGDAGMRALLGGKGANLAEMAAIGLPVPPGFTITTALCNGYYDAGRTLPGGLDEEIEAGLAHVESIAGTGFGDPGRTLLVSVRSGARASMPGMMDTVLNLGLNDETADGLAQASGDARFAYDSYRRLIQMYGDVVLGVPHRAFEELLEREKEARGYRLGHRHGGRRLVPAHRRLQGAGAGRDRPGLPAGAARAARRRRPRGPRFMDERARRHLPQAARHPRGLGHRGHGPGHWCSATWGGTAPPASPSPAIRRPERNVLYGEYLVNAQGEDVVSGIRTPRAVSEAGRAASGTEGQSMERSMPEAYAALQAVMGRLERHYRDMQDVEFTVQRGMLWILQTREGKRTAKAALKIAVDMAREGLVSEAEALTRVDPLALEQLLHPTLDPAASRQVLARGLPASPGAACGKVVFDADEAEDRAARGEAVILLRTETSPEDIHGMHAARGIVTSRGGMTSHAAVVARGMGRPCITGAAGELRIDEAARTCRAGGAVIAAGDVVTIDGASGELLQGAVRTIEPALSDDFTTLMGWADRARRLRVRANAETPRDAETALRFGAEGIGLCRTEHMFFDDVRIVPVREMIVAADADGRRAALAKLLPTQRKDFAALFRLMAGLPVTIRLLDPPLHEFLPRTEAEIAKRRRRRRRRGGGTARAHRAAARDQPDAGAPRLPPRDLLPGDLRDAGPRHLRGGRPRPRASRRSCWRS